MWYLAIGFHVTWTHCNQMDCLISVSSVYIATFLVLGSLVPASRSSITITGFKLSSFSSATNYRINTLYCLMTSKRKLLNAYNPADDTV